MSALVLVPNPVLRTPSLLVEPDDPVDDLVQMMIATMHDHAGIGLAAVQIGVPKRVVVMAVNGLREPTRTFLNPTILHRSIATEAAQEGCLSIPEAREDVVRSLDLVLRYETIERETRVETFEGLAARCLQHELDHLDGVLFIDHLSKLKRKRIMQKIAKSGA